MQQNVAFITADFLYMFRASSAKCINTDPAANGTISSVKYNNTNERALVFFCMCVCIVFSLHLYIQRL
jgi:hypothetical protein